MNERELWVDLGYPDPPPPRDLADRARRQGTAMRRRRQAATGAGVLAVSVVAVLIGTILPQRLGGHGLSPVVTDPAHQPSSTPPTTAGPTATGRTSVTPTATAGSACTAGELKVTVGNSSGAAGHTYLELLFTRVGSRTCTLQGYPGVSFLDATGRQLGAAATRDHTVNASRVQLAPGATAHSSLGTVNTGVYGDPGTAPCNATTATTIRVYPPGSREAIRIPTTVSVCRSTTLGAATVQPVSAGRMP